MQNSGKSISQMPKEGLLQSLGISREQLLSGKAPKPPQFAQTILKIKSKFTEAFNSREIRRLNRLLSYTQLLDAYSKYPRILHAYIVYNGFSIAAIGLAIFGPKKLINKAILSSIVYGIKLNIGDGLFMFYSLEQMALSNKMNQNEQELRNLLQFYLMKRIDDKNNQDQIKKQNDRELIAKIRAQSKRYKQYKQIESTI